MGLELRVVISANIKTTIAVILSPSSSLYDLQKPRYDFPVFAISRTAKSPIFAFSVRLHEVGIPRSCYYMTIMETFQQ